MSSKPFIQASKNFQSDKIQRSSHKIFTAHYASRNADLNLTLVTEMTNGFIKNRIILDVHFLTQKR